jgi:pilus assembly protein CpaF
LTVFSIVISEKGGAERRQTFELREVSIGRVQGNDLVLPKGNVSKRHCRIEWAPDGRFFVSDQNSTNGTYLNRRRIAQATLVRQGDRIYLGDYVLRIEEGEGSQAEASVVVQDGPALANASSPSAPPPSMPPPGAAPRISPEVEITPEQQLAGSHGQVTGQMPGAVPLARTDERDSEIDAEMQVEAFEFDAHIISCVRFLVERVLGAVGRIEDPVTLAPRVDALLEEAAVELQRDPALDAARLLALKHHARNELLEVGPIGELLGDPSINEIAASGNGYLTFQRGSERAHALPFCAPGSLERAVERLCAHEGVPLHPNEQLAQRFLPSWAMTLDLVRGPTSPDGPIVRLRRRDGMSVNLEDLVRAGTLSRNLATFLSQCVTGRANILIVGSSASGAQQLLAALARAAEGERLLWLGDGDPSTLEGRSMMLHEAPGVRLDLVLARVADVAGHRLVVDGISQGGRALAILRAMFEGAEGVLARLPMRSIERGVSQMVAQMALGSQAATPAALADSVVAGFDLAIEVGRLRDGRSRVLRVAELGRAQDGSITANDIFTFVVDRIASGGAVEGSFNPSGRRPHFALALKTRGVRIDSGIFGRAARTTIAPER